MAYPTRRNLFLGGAALGAFGLLPPAYAQTPTKGGTLVYATVSGPGTLDPHVSSSLVELEVIHNVFEGLVALDHVNATKTMLASSATASPDSRTYTFVLRQGVKFHTGAEMTSADVQSSFERYQRVSPNAENYNIVDRYETPDPHTFVVHLKSPNYVFLDILKSPIFPLMIIPVSEATKPARDIDIVGTGPFALSEWVKDGHLTIKRFDGYALDTTSPGRDGYAGRKVAYLDAVRFNFIPEASTRIAALQTGEVQLASNIPSELRHQVESQSKLAIHEVFPVGGSYVILNSQYGLTSNVLIRQAIAAAVNISDITDATGGLNKPNPWMSFPNTPYYLGTTAPTPWYNQNNPTKAAALLKQAGYNNEKLIIETNDNYDWMKTTMLVVQAQLQAAGMNVDVRVVDWTTNAADMQEHVGKWNLSTTLFGPDHILGPQEWRPLLYGFPNIKGNKALDDAYAEFFASPALGGRRAAWLKIQQQVLGGGYMVKIADSGRLFGYAKTLQGQTDYPGILQLWGLYFA